MCVRSLLSAWLQSEHPMLKDFSVSKINLEVRSAGGDNGGDIVGTCRNKYRKALMGRSHSWNGQTMENEDSVNNLFFVSFLIIMFKVSFGFLSIIPFFIIIYFKTSIMVILSSFSSL